jgi:hypothetical protein
MVFRDHALTSGRPGRTGSKHEIREGGEQFVR